MQRWDPRFTNEDLVVEHATLSPKSDVTIWRCAVAARPIRGHAYVDFLIDRNPKPENRAIQIGIVSRADLDGVTKPGANFINFKSGISWCSNGGFITANDALAGSFREWFLFSC